MKNAESNKWGAPGSVKLFLYISRYLAWPCFGELVDKFGKPICVLSAVENLEQVPALGQ